MKKWLAMLMAIVMLTASLPVAASAAEDIVLELFDGAEKIVVCLGEEVETYNYIITPEEAYETLYIETWESSDTQVVSVEADDWGNYWLKAVGPGTTTLTATLDNGVSDTVTVVVPAPTVWQGEQTKTVLLNRQYAQRVFAFTAPETGVYTISSANAYGAFLEVLDEQLEYIASSDETEDGLGFTMTCAFESGKTYYFDVTSATAEQKGAHVFDMTVAKGGTLEDTSDLCKTDAITLCVGDLYCVQYNVLDYSVGVQITSTNDAVAEVEYDMVTAKAVGTANIIIRTDTGKVDVIAVTVKPARVLTEDEEMEVTCEESMHIMRLSFTPSQNGEYVFYSQNGAGFLVYLYDENGEWLDYSQSSISAFSIKATLRVGETYTLQLSTHVKGNVDLCVSKATAATTMAMELISDSYITAQQKEYLAYAGTYSFLEFTFGEEKTAAAEEVVVESDNETAVLVEDSSWVSFENAGTATLTATSENGLTDSLTIQVIDYVNGDIDRSGKLVLADVTKLFYHVNGTTRLQGDAIALADVTGDNTVTLLDAQTVFYTLNGII